MWEIVFSANSASASPMRRRLSSYWRPTVSASCTSPAHSTSPSRISRPSRMVTGWPSSSTSNSGAPGTGVGAVGAEHPAQLGDDRLPLERVDARLRNAGRAVLLDAEVAVGHRRDLRQVRYAEDLAVIREAAEPLAHRAGRLTANTGVDLVEGQRLRAT